MLDWYKRRKRQSLAVKLDKILDYQKETFRELEKLNKALKDLE